MLWNLTIVSNVSKPNVINSLLALYWTSECHIIFKDP